MGSGVISGSPRSAVAVPKMAVIDVRIPKEASLIIGQAHFIKAVEDIYEALVNSVPGIKLGIGFCEASGKCLVRHEGNDEELRERAKKAAFEIGAGHCFVVFIRNSYPINVLGRLKEVPEVCNILCATSNPVQVLVAETDQGRSVVGVVDGFKTKGVEDEGDIKERREFLRRIGYKF